MHFFFSLLLPKKTPVLGSFFLVISVLLFCVLSPVSAQEVSAEEWYTGNMRLKYEYQHFTLRNVQQYIREEKKNTQEDVPVGFCFDEEPNHVVQSEKGLDLLAIQNFLESTIAPKIEREVSHVKIFRDESQKIQFEGYGYTGVSLDIKTSAELIAYAIRNGASQVTLAVDITLPQVRVEDEELKKLGIQELVAVGRSDFYPSSRSRIQNIMAGAKRFNGFLVLPGEEFSFNTQLGRVDASTGYAEEYVILGPKVEKEYGGGLCQVSSTAYRGVMLAGLEIVERHNHSFAVNHYLPYGSDATIYQGVKDFRFKNDTDTALLIQTRRGGHRNSELFFHYYGTKPSREVKIFGPTMKNFKNALPPKTTYSVSVPEGTSKKVSNAVRGFDSSFGRVVNDILSGENLYTDKHFSHYQARGDWTIMGGVEPASSPEIAREAFVEPLTQN